MANSDKKPWEVDARLDEEALSVVGKLLLSIRRNVAARQQPNEGDSTWGLGCCTYERFKYQTIRLEQQKTYPWLGVVNVGKEFSFSINGCPIRQYKGDSENPPAKQIERAREQQLKLFPDQAINDPDWHWLLAVETDGHGVGIRVVVLQAHADGDIRYRCVVARATDLISDAGPAPATPAVVIHPTTDSPEPVIEPLPSSEIEKKPK
jgi:hypothetical protein